MTPDTPHGTWIETDVPPRLDALGWSRWHKRVVIALGITWILDGLEASLISNLAPTLQKPEALGLSESQIGIASSVYLAGQVAGALLFGWLTDRLGRKRLFLVTLGLYLAATALSGLAPGLGVFLVFRFLAGAGIGGEYSAINSAIDELVPARIRGQVDLAINGSYWIGAGLAAAGTMLLVDPHLVPPEWGWRIAFFLGAVLGLGILLVRRHVPESPRWLLTHGYVAAAHDTVVMIERDVHGGEPPAREVRTIRFKVVGRVGFRQLIHAMIVKFPRRTALGVALLVAQAFLYNAIFFSYGLVLTKFHHVAADRVGLFMMPFALGNFLGPVVLGPLFDRWGRRLMISATYALSGVLLLISGALFLADLLDAYTQTLAWGAVFFVASAAASSAYLTVSELYPIELRGLVIGAFYAFATLLSAGAPALFGVIVQSGEPGQLFTGYAIAAILMIGAAIVARAYAVDAEGRSLEEITHHHTD